MEARKPTDAELAILQVLWERGPSTVREVHRALERSRATGYTTILKLMQIMAEKGLVIRDEAARAHVYRPRFAREQMQRRLVSELLHRVFGGSATQLVMQALSAKRASPQELAAIRRMLEEFERKRE